VGVELLNNESQPSTDKEATMEERKGVITFKGNPMTLLGPEIETGDKAPISGSWTRGWRR